MTKSYIVDFINPGKIFMVHLPVLLMMKKDYAAAAMLEQVGYLSSKCENEDDFFYISPEEVEEDIFLDRKQQTKAVIKLKKLGLIDTKVVKDMGEAIVYFRFNQDAFDELLEKTMEEDEGE